MRVGDGTRPALTALAVLALSALVSADPSPVYVSACVADAGPAWRAAAALLPLVLQQAEPAARVLSANCKCAAFDKDCADKVLRSRKRRAQVEMALPMQAAWLDDAARVRDDDAHDMGDAMPPTRRVCRARAAPASRALPALDNSTAFYKLTNEDITNICADEVLNCTLSSVERGGCAGEAGLCGVALVERRELPLWSSALGTLQLRLLPLAALPAREPLPGRPLLLCAWAPEYSAAAQWLHNTTELATPPCVKDTKDCPFETQRLMKVSTEKVHDNWPRLSRALRHFQLKAKDMRELAKGVTPEQWMERNKDRVDKWLKHEWILDVLTLIPNSGAREAYNGTALNEAVNNVNSSDWINVKANVWALDDNCSKGEAARCLASSTPAPHVVAGPACGGAAAGVQAVAQRGTPLLSYTWASGGAGAWAVRGAGEPAAAGRALAALLHAQRWRRVAALTEPAWAPAWQALEGQVPHVLRHTLLNDHSDDIDSDAIERWAKAAAGLRARILVVLVEDARAARAALCAGWREGLRPRDGAVWLLPATLRRGWLAGDECARSAAEGHLAVRPTWLAPPHLPRSWNNSQRSLWSESGGTLDPHAALLYDMLITLLRAFKNQIKKRNASILDEHPFDNVTRSILDEIEKDEYVGLTGRAQWRRAQDGSLERDGSLELLQWHAESDARRVASWTAGDGLRWEGEPPLWSTLSGAAPGDGEPCALQTVADSLGVPCGAAAALVTVAALAALLALLRAAYALVCRRYNKRLHELESRARAAQPDPDWELLASDVVINYKLGEGAFGIVYYGSARLPGRDEFTMVAVKQMKRRSQHPQSLIDRADFLQESETMKQFDHPNVVKLLGVATLNGNVAIVIQLAAHGSLKGWLLARREAAARGAAETAPARLTALAAGAARALSYLADLQYVHCDVAARNCLVAGDGHLLLSDFGLTRTMFDRDYYVPGRRARRPVRWLAPEALAGRYSPASDVWALGVLIYEMVTFGAVPYPDRCEDDVAVFVQRGGAPEPPPGLHPKLKGMLRAMWRQRARERPAASEVAALLGETRPPLLSASLLAAAAAACETRSTGLYADSLAPASPSPPTPTPPTLTPPTPTPPTPTPPTPTPPTPTPPTPTTPPPDEFVANIPLLSVTTGDSWTRLP